MKTNITLLLAATAITAFADTKVSDRTALSSGDLAPATDILPIVDVSAGTSGSKKITINDLFSGWGAASLTGAQTLTNKTLTAPIINAGSDATGDIYYRSSGGAFSRLGIGTTGQVLTVASGLPSWATGGGGGLTNWTDGIATDSYNTSINVASLTATGAGSNISAGILPKGNGGLTLQIPNGLATGGDARGIKSVDLQLARSASNQVAAGIYSFVVGSNNRAVGSAAAAIGSTNTTGGDNAVAIGLSNTASVQESVAIGKSNTASSQNAVAIGLSTTSSGFASIALGSSTVSDGRAATVIGEEARARGITGAFVRGVGKFSTTGDVQAAAYILKASTTNATATEMSVSGVTPSAATRIALPNEGYYRFRARMIAAQSTTRDAASWEISGLIKRGASASATSIVGTVTGTGVSSMCDTGAAAWSVAVDADTTNGSLRIIVTGEASKSIRWVADVQTVELTY